MENLDLLNDTIIAEALAYCDELEPVLDQDKIISGIEIGEMSELEKRLHTLSVLKNREIKMMFENISGKELENSPKDEWTKQVSETISTEHNLHYYEKFNQLDKEVDSCKKLMWILISLRFTQQRSVLVIRSGFKIVALKNSENVFLPGGILSSFN